MKDQLLAGADIDDIAVPCIGSEAIASVQTTLLEIGYVFESRSSLSNELVKHVAGCPIQVNVSRYEIAFSVPAWGGSKLAVTEAVRDSATMCENRELVFFNPQDGSVGP